MSLKKLLSSKEGKYFILAFLLNLLLILFIYKSVFTLEFQGDGWQYAWGHHVYYESNVFSKESLKGMRTSLAGASLTFGLIENNFGLNALVFYTISVILKFISVITFYFLIKKLTNNNLASLIGSLILSATFAGVEATHWVFNMYAYIGLIFITLSLLIGIDLPQDYKFKKWLISFGLACVGVWYATMRTNGIIPLIIVWSFYKFLTLRSKSSKINLISWILGFAVFIVIDKFLLGQMETSYSRQYIIGEGLKAFQTQVANNKFDFLFSSASNLGVVILPDVTWFFFNFPKIFSFFVSGVFRSIMLPSLAIFTIISWILTAAIRRGSGISAKFLFLFCLGLVWTLVVYFILLLGPANFSSWVALVVTLFGGYFMIICLFLLIIKETPTHLKDLCLLTFLWSFVYLLLPLFQNGGPILGTSHRYLATTALVVPMFMAGLITLSSIYKNNLLKNLTLIIVFLMIFSHASQTKAFFDRKAMVHNREVSNKVWHQLKKIIPNKAEYRDNPPTMFFTSADNPLDQQTLFESLYFGLGFRMGVDYGWRPDHLNAIYNHGDYTNLVRDVKKNPKLLDEFYAVLLTNQSLTDVTKEVKEKIALDILK